MVALRKEKLRQARIDAAVARLDGTPLPEGGRWITSAREAALARVHRMGLPTRRDEYWKFTDPSTLTERVAKTAALFPEGADDRQFAETDTLKIVFVDGVFDPGQSDDLSLAGIEVERLAEAGVRDIHWARDLYGVLENAGQDPVERPLAALNTALATDGILIRAKGKAAKPVNLIYLRSAEASDVCLHHVIRVEKGAELTLLENGPAAARFSTVTEVDVADGARFHHVRAQGRDHQRRAVTHLFARLGEESLLKSFTLSLNGELTRNEAVVTLTGRDASAHVAGATVGDGAFLHDDTVFIRHAAERCESRQVFKKVLRNGAVGVFQGKILVDQVAQLTDGYQISQSLLLGEDSQFLAKPELEIYADDVKCSHGSTSGEINSDQLHYLRTRGVPEEDAKALLVLAFLAEAIEEIEDEGLGEDIRARLREWLERRRG